MGTILKFAFELKTMASDRSRRLRMQVSVRLIGSARCAFGGAAIGRERRLPVLRALRRISFRAKSILSLDRIAKSLKALAGVEPNKIRSGAVRGLQPVRPSLNFLCFLCLFAAIQNPENRDRAHGIFIPLSMRHS